jgi:hypothetical protein
MNESITVFAPVERDDCYELLSDMTHCKELSSKRWLLIAHVVNSKDYHPLVFVSSSKRILEKLMERRDFQNYSLLLLPDELPSSAVDTPASGRDVSICNLDPDCYGLRTDWRAILWWAGYETYGDVADGGAKGLQRLGFGGEFIKAIRGCLRERGVHLPPLQDRKTAQPGEEAA